MEKYPEVGKHVETLFMENRSIGRHAGGVIIAPPDELASTMPIIGVRGDLQTPWTETAKKQQGPMGDRAFCDVTATGSGVKALGPRQQTRPSCDVTAASNGVNPWSLGGK